MLGDITTASQQTLKTSIGCRGIGLHSGKKVRLDYVQTLIYDPTERDTGYDISALAPAPDL